MSKRNGMLLLSILLFTVIVSIPLFDSYAANNDDDAVLSAILYDTNAYSGGTGTELTVDGAIVNAWTYDTSKYLQINPTVPDDGNIYSITVKLPQEFYVVTNSVVTLQLLLQIIILLMYTD